MFRSLDRKKLALLGVVAAALTAGLGVARLASAGTFTVNSPVDPGDGVCTASECTLREAISAANTNPGPDVINFDPTVFSPATITLTSPLPPVTDAATTITGAGATVTVDGSLLHPAGAFEGVLQVLAPSAGFKGFTIDNAPNFGILVSPAGPVTSLSVTNMIIDAEIQYGVSVFSESNIRNVTVSGSTISGTGGVSITGVGSRRILIENNVSIAASPLAEAIGIFGGNNTGVAITGNGSINGEVFIHSLGDSNSDISVRGNAHISGGVVLSAATNDGVSIRGNDAISGRGVAILGDNNSGISISDNESITGGSNGVSISGISGASTSNSHIAIRGNGSISSGGSGVVLDGGSNSSISVRGNESISGNTGIFISGGNQGPLNVISNNRVQASVAGFGIGISLFGSDLNQVKSNDVVGFSLGIALQAESNFNTIRRNVVGVTSDADLFWDGTGTGNRWIRNECDTSLPAGLCE